MSDTFTEVLVSELKAELEAKDAEIARLTKEVQAERTVSLPCPACGRLIEVVLLVSLGEMK